MLNPLNLYKINQLKEHIHFNNINNNNINNNNNNNNNNKMRLFKHL